MSNNRHLSMGKIGSAVRQFLAHCRKVPKDTWILFAGLIIIGTIGTLTTYPAALPLVIVLAVVLLFYTKET